MQNNDHILEKTNQLIILDNKADLKSLIFTMSQQAKKYILIFSHHLDSQLFDNEALYEVIKHLAIKSPRTYIKILLQDSKPMTTNGHRLLTLARRISSHIEIKVVAKEHLDIIETFLIFDDHAYIIHQHPERYEAEANFSDPLKTKHLNEQFKEMWDHATIDSSLRQLSL